jgi:hypothetical protein
MTPDTTKLLVAVQRMVDATTPEENNHRVPTISGHQLKDLLKVVIVLAAPAEAEVVLVMATVAAEAAAAGAHHTMLAESWWWRRSPESHTSATMPAVELKKYITRRPLRQRQRWFPRFLRSTLQPASPRDVQTSGDHQV